MFEEPVDHGFKAATTTLRIPLRKELKKFFSNKPKVFEPLYKLRLLCLD